MDDIQMSHTDSSETLDQPVGVTEAISDKSPSPFVKASVLHEEDKVVSPRNHAENGCTNVEISNYQDVGSEQDNHVNEGCLEKTKEAGNDIKNESRSEHEEYKKELDIPNPPTVQAEEGLTSTEKSPNGRHIEDIPIQCGASEMISDVDSCSKDETTDSNGFGTEVTSSSGILKGILENSDVAYPSKLDEESSSKSVENGNAEINKDTCTNEMEGKMSKSYSADETEGIHYKGENAISEFSHVKEDSGVAETEAKLTRNTDNEESDTIPQNTLEDSDTSQNGMKREIDKSEDCIPSASSASSGTVTEERNPGNLLVSVGQSNDDNVIEKPTKYRCSKCSCVTKDKRLFDNHSCDREFGSEEDKVKITIELSKGKNAFVCTECNFSSTGHGFEEHLMCHLMLRPYQCLYCKECFINRREISRHVIKSHNGAKMSCALRALRRAKGLIKEVTAAGTLTFMARVAGKVPLEKDPEKKKSMTAQLKASDFSSKSTIPTSEKDLSKESLEKEQTCQKEEEENKEELENKEEGKFTDDETESKSSAAVPFSKLREVLTSENPLQHVEGKESEETTPSTAFVKEEVKEQKKCEDQGLKIIASYSLNDESSMEEAPTEQNKEQENTQKSPQPNFFMASPPFAPEPELVSFLGPERSGLRYSDRSSPLLPPPPLKPAPLPADVPSTSSVDTFQQSAIPTKPEKISNFFICSFICSFNSISKSEYLEHLMDFHTNETSFSCYYCGHKSLHIEDMVNHTVSHADNSMNKKSPLFICSISDCQFGSNMISDFINHVNASHKDGNKPACNACVSVFPEVSSLQTHLEENIIHIVNCPHCPCKASDRRAILNHISLEHPGKPKMVSVVKQLICRDRKMNGYERPQPTKEMHPPSLTPTPNSNQGHSVLDQILRRQDARNVGPHLNSSMADTLTGSPSTSPRNTPSPASRGLSPFSSRKLGDTPESERSPRSEISDFSGIRVKEEIEEMGYEDSKETDGLLENNSSYIIDENGVRKRLYVPMSERHAENFCCRYCTFVARDLKRLACHERSHGMPPTRKDRFKCMFCPQGFDSEMKFRLHITCHPGLIKFLLYKCKKCEFDSNQKHTIVKHITCNRDRKHRGIGPVEDQYTIISRSLESRVLECEQCHYMTRHKVHMAIHYQREHGILRDKNEFTIEGLTPSDTPVTGSDLGQFGEISPQSEVSSQLDFSAGKSFSACKKRKESTSSDGTNLSMGEIYERNELFTRLVSQQAALQPGHVLENQARKFKCPICKYLLPKAADLKNHVKRHSEIGQITLVMFRCKYCSCMSTARELLYDHLRDKHPGKSIALVKKIVAIDTTETDKSFAETSVEESLQQLEESVHNEIMSAINSSQSQAVPIPSKKQPTSSRSLEQLFVIPQGGDTFQAALQCPKCSLSSHHRVEIIQHVTEKHPEIKIISSDEDVDNLAKSASEDLHRNKSPHGSDTPPLSSQEEVLIVPDEPNFKETALCSRCDFSTNLRKDMVLHLQQNHPEISVMGRNSYPVQVSTMGSRLGENVLEESCVVGSGSLDSKLRVLYENYGTQMKCLICGIERPKKFFIHVHILRHLNIYLWKCTFCSHRGLQKYKMVDHIKKIHPGRPMSVRYLRVNVEARVAQFLAQFNTIQNHMSTPDNTDISDEFLDQSGDDSKGFSQKSHGGIPHALGGDELDAKISCLYDFSDGLFYKCLACNNQFQRKFAIHRHIIISHLKVALLSCAYCGMEGVEKHQMVDHILACHHSQPVSFQTNDIDIVQAVANFLAKSAANDDLGLNQSFPLSGEAGAHPEGFYHQVLSTNKSRFMGFDKNFKFPFGSKLKGKGADRRKKTTGNKNKTIVDPGVIMLGREALDRELNSLYQARQGGQLRCLVCRWEFPRKYPLHRHIMLKHLRMNLVACPYCSFNGVEKYTVSTHIKEEHRDQPISIRYIQPDVKERVRQFLNEMASGSSKIQKQMSTTSSPSLSMLVKMKREKSLKFDNGENEEEEGEEEDEDDEKNEKPSSGQGLVVAMFGKKNKKATLSDDIVIKTETEDDEYYASTKPKAAFSEDNNHETNDEEEGEENEEEERAGTEMGESPSFFNRDGGKPPKSEHSKSEHVDNKILSKFQKMEAYAPGSYRSPTGGKPKALDVITKIKVLKSREGPITKFYCEKCKFTSVHRSNIVRHIYKIHERYQTHACPVCNYQTLSMMLMQTHMNKEHPGTEFREDSFTLNPPQSKPRSRSLLGVYNYQQRRRKQKYKTPAFKPPAPPPVTSCDRGPKQYACAYCHYETNTQEDILEHTREKHSQGFNNAETMSPSSKKSDDSSRACWDRSKKAVKRKLSEGSDAVTQSKRKFIFEKGDELIQCGHCEVRETSMGRMQHHMEVDHAGFPMQFKRIPAWRFVCKTCAVKTMATSKMKYHLNRHVSYRPYTCVNCGAFFPSPDQCRRHARANRHDEQYMYVRNAKKEQRVEELLQETRQLALRIQDEAYRDPTFDIANTESFMARYQDTKNNLKRSGGSATNPRAAKKAKAEEKATPVVRKQVGKSPQTVGIEMNVTIKCYNCDFQASTVNEVMLHHKKAHPGAQFYWTELDRGFTCDRTGEALMDCDTLPNSSGDVGYSTKISLSVGSNSTRFKCKSCDFSSCVIQAMKSHLKSHQPKGYICPYCSRFFSGKEKLMRHQYCLHKGSSIWVIHLRKSSANTSSMAKAATGNSHAYTRRSTREISSSEKDSIAEENKEEEKDAHKDESNKGNSSQLRFVCNECPFSSDNLLQYRQHLSKAHEAFRQGAKETSITIEESEEEKGIQSPYQKETHFQCGYCKFQASEMEDIEEHHEEVHSGNEPQILDVSIERPPDDEDNDDDDDGDIEDEEAEPIKKPLLNLEPRVAVKRIPSSTIAWYDDAHSSPSDDANEEFDETPGQLGEIGTHAEGEFNNSSAMHFDQTIENDTKRGEEEDNFAEEGVSLSGVDDEQGEKEINDETVEDRFSEEKSDSHLSEEEKEEEVEEENFMDRGNENTNESDNEFEEDVNAEMNVETGDNPDDIARQFGLVDDGMSSPVRSESEMMIMEFDSLQRNQMLTSTIDNEISEDDAMNKVSNNVGETDDDDGDDDDEDDEDDEFDENSVTLASPLPMISLGDGVTMSPDMFSSRSEGKSETEANQENSQYSNSSAKDVYNNKHLLDF